MSAGSPYVVDLPAAGPADDLWRIEFYADGRQRRIDNSPGYMARDVELRWKLRRAGRLICCRMCPPGYSDCPHDELPEQRGWRFTDITELRIMPMREAV